MWIVRLAGLTVVLAFLFYGFHNRHAGVAHAGKLDPTSPLVDTDNDGCTDQEELAAGRDPNDPRDFLDMPPRDNRIRGSDILAVVKHFGTQAGTDRYYPAYDPGQSGRVTGIDILAIVRQYGRSCYAIQ